MPAMPIASQTWPAVMRASKATMVVTAVPIARGARCCLTEPQMSTAIPPASRAVMRSGSGVSTMISAMEEIYELAHARGIELPADSVDKVMASVDGLAEDVTSSMQRDIIAGKPSELESQNGAVVRMARESGVEVPTHDLIYRTLKYKEAQRAT